MEVSLHYLLLFLSMADCRSWLYSFICLLIYFSSMRLNSLWCNSQGCCSLGKSQSRLQGSGRAATVASPTGGVPTHLLLMGK